MAYLTDNEFVDESIDMQVRSTCVFYVGQICHYGPTWKDEHAEKKSSIISDVSPLAVVKEGVSISIPCNTRFFVGRRYKMYLTFVKPPHLRG